MNWISYDLITKAGSRYQTSHRNSPTRPYTASSVIAPQNGEHLQQLFEQSYSPFVQLRDAYSLDRVIGAFVDARGGSFLETRGLAAVSLLDVLRGKWAETKGITYVVEPDLFAGIQSDVKTRTVQTLLEIVPGIKKEQAQAMAVHVCGLNWNPLRRVLKAMFKDLGIECSNKELQSFIKTRNALVHSGTFCSQSPVEEYFAVVSLLDRVLLRLVGYTGEYVDYRDLQVEKA